MSDNQTDQRGTGELAAELRRLLSVAERASGTPIKVHTLAKKLHLSPSSLYAYLEGRTLPSRVVLDNLLHELGVSGPELGRIADLRDTAEDLRRARRKRPAAGTAGVPPPGPVVSPCQLPPDVRGFIGRKEQLAALDELLAEGERTPAPAVAVVCGTAGVGKTALVAHWAHRVRQEFPDGLLYVDLRGFDPEQPLEPGDVLGSFLRSLGVAGDSIPQELAERAALFRARLDGRRILLFLDNASSEEQVRYLLPNSARCFVVVTSRNTLPGLVARHGAHRVDVESLPVDDAIALLRILIDARRVDADEEGAAALVERCARLPLAIRIGADLAATRRRSALTELAAELERYHLDLFSAGGDERTAVRTVFSWSYLHLRADRARAFRLLGLHPGHDLDTHAGAALLGADLYEAQLRIDDLVRANLLEEAGHRRYRMHDLLRAYAREQVSADESDEAVQRLFDYYIGTAAAAMNLIAPHDRHHRLAIPEPAAARAPLPDAAAALDWLDTERVNLLTLAEYAAGHGWPVVVVHTSALLYRYLDTRAYYGDALTLHNLALDTARAAGDVKLEGVELHRLGIVHMRLGHHLEARDQLEHALRISRRSGNRVLEGRALHHLGHACIRLADNENALRHLRGALPAVRETGDGCLEAHVLCGIGFVHGQLGRYTDALTYHKRAISVAIETGDQELVGHVLNSLGLIYQRVGYDSEALGCHRRALGIARQVGNRGLEADSLKSIGVIHLAQGHDDEAAEILEVALAIAMGIGHQDIEGYARRTLGRLHGYTGDIDQAVVHLRRALLIASETGNRELEVEVLNGYGEILAATEPDTAAQYHERALGIARESGNPWQEAQSRAALAHAYVRLGRHAEADDHRQRAHAIYRTTGVRSDP